MTKRPIATDQAPAAVGPYSQAIESGDLVFCSGQIGLDPATGILVDGGVTAQAQQALTNIGAVLRAAGLDYADVVKTTLFLADIGDFVTVNAIYATFFPGVPPARSTFAAAGLPKGAVVEVEAIASHRAHDEADA